MVGAALLIAITLLLAWSDMYDQASPFQEDMPAVN